MHSRDSSAVERESVMQDGCEHKSVAEETLRTELESVKVEFREDFFSVINFSCLTRREKIRSKKICGVNESGFNRQTKDFAGN